MTVLWVVALLSIAVFTAAQFLFVELEAAGNSSGIFIAEQMADRGIALASHPGMPPGDLSLSRSISAMESYSARIGSEGGYLNLNFLLDPEHRIVLEEVFYQWGLRSDEAINVVDALTDWVDPDDEPTGIGAENRFYLSQERINHPYNREFSSLEEAPLVEGFALVQNAKPDWRNYFTLLSQGELDLNEADPDMIAATCQCPLQYAQQLVSTRNGPDGILGSDDDTKIESVEDALNILQVNEGIRDIVESRLSIEDPVKRLISIGRFGSIEVERTVSVQYNGDRGEILQWSTRRIQ